MGVNQSRSPYTYDGADAVVLRDVTDGAETSTTTEAGISLSELDHAYWHSNEIPHGVLAVVVHVTALNLSTNTYTFAVVVDDTANMSDTPTVVASAAISATGLYVFYIDSALIKALDTETSGADKWIATRVTTGGTPDSPSFTYGAWIAKSLRK